LDTDTAEILQIGAVMIHPRKLKIVSTFGNVLLCPEKPDEISKEALNVNKLNLDELKAAAPAKSVWETFVSWVCQYNHGNGTYTAPIPCGYNILGYDMKLVDRYCKQYGPWSKSKNSQGLFNAVYSVDLLQHMWFWTESLDIPINIGSLTAWLGWKKEIIEGTHNALVDSTVTAKIIIRLLNLQRYLTQPDQDGKIRLEMAGSCANDTLETK
jgi:hypothetical protein